MTKSDMEDTITLTAETPVPHTGAAAITRIVNPTTHFVIRQYTSGDYEITSNRRIKKLKMRCSPQRYSGEGENYCIQTEMEVEMFPSSSAGSEQNSSGATTMQKNSKTTSRKWQFWRSKST